MTTYFAFLQLFINILKETVGNEIHSENRNQIGIYENTAFKWIEQWSNFMKYIVFLAEKWSKWIIEREQDPM